MHFPGGMKGATMIQGVSFVAHLLVLQVFISSGVYGGPKAGHGTATSRQSQRFLNIPPYKATVKVPSIQHVHTCDVSSDLKDEIAGYSDIVDTIVKEALTGSFKGRTYDELGNFVDLYGPRISGSQVLEDSIDYMMQQMKDNGLENIYAEDVTVPHYFRGEESAELLTPRKKKLAILGLVPSIGTPAEGITAEVLVVRNFDELKAQAEHATGKIIVFNQDWAGNYEATVKYRNRGAIEAARYGGIAALIRSIADFSLDTPHTGKMDYSDDIPRIPAACITAEDAKLLYRHQEAGMIKERSKEAIFILGDKKRRHITIHLRMANHQLLAPKTSRNSFGEITGYEKPYELVAVSGHIDSWDVGDGALDDAAGTQMSVEALYLLKTLGLRPRRTLQAILWTAEEAGYIGALQYAERHMNELKNFSAVFESDGGAFNAVGLDFAGTNEAGCIVYEILKLLKPYGMNEYAKYNRVAYDIEVLEDNGVPGFSLRHDNDHYFWYHHTEADVLTVLDSDELDRCTAIWAAVSYVLADLTDPLPRGPF